MRNLLLLILLAFGFAAPGALSAEPDRVSILLGSKHIGAQVAFEETNPGLFLTWEGDRVDFSLGAYHNSYGRTSVAAMWGLPVLSGDRGEVSLIAGVAYYPENGRTFKLHAGDFVPMVGVQARYGNLFLQAYPGDGAYMDGLVAMGVTFPLN